MEGGGGGGGGGVFGAIYLKWFEFLIRESLESAKRGDAQFMECDDVGLVLGGLFTSPDLLSA